MKQVEYILLGLCLLYGLTATLAASCADGKISSNQCNQTCWGTDCTCHSTEASNFDSCSQKCETAYCYDDINITCIAQENCIQVCESGLCHMTCNAEDYCDQIADHNGVKAMSCSSKQCEQSCEKGNCVMMHCEADACLQTCHDEGGCEMICTESVKICSQSCTANKKCTLDCRAEVCLQECSGPKECIIVNTAPSQVNLHFSLLFIAFLMLLLQ